MSDPGDIFGFPRDVAVTALAAWLAPVGRAVVDGPLRARREWLDTFDWRLFGAGLVLEIQQAGPDRRLRLVRVDGAAPWIEVPCPQRPRFAPDLPGHALRRQLAPLMDLRALMVRRTVAGTLHELRVLDGADKTVARLDLWRARRAGDCVARVVALRGFPEAAAALARRVGAHRDARRLGSDPLIAPAGDLATEPGRYPGWKLGGFDPGMRTDDAVQRLLGHYRHVMDLNVPGMLDDVDSEFLHDFRVGLRRTRAILRRMPGVFPPGRLAPFREDFAWLAAITGAPRDADVHCLVFPRYAAAVGGDDGALAPLYREVAREQVQAHDALVEALDTPRFRRRWAAWARFLARPAPRASRQPAGPTPLAASAGKAILEATRRVRRDGARLTPKSPPAQYHDLRKSCKNLRYLIDAYGECLDDPKLEKATRRLKKLQDVLGEHQDLDVHRASLAGLHQVLADNGALGGETHVAMERLMAHLARRSAEVRGHFAAEFARFLAVRVDRSLAKRLPASRGPADPP